MRWPHDERQDRHTRGEAAQPQEHRPEIPRNTLIVFTGLSGSGKSSLAFDTIYAEGQRRYVESLSAYARQFLGQMDKPDVDFIEGLSPAISIDQKTTSRNPRSTVGTVTEIYDYLRLLYARIGRPHCPNCGQPIASADGGADRRPGHGPGRRDPGAGAGAGGAGPQGRVQQALRGDPPGRLRPGAGRRRAAGRLRRDRAGQEQEARDRRSSSTGSSSARAWQSRLADSVETALEAGGRHRPHRRGGRGGAALLREICLRRLRHQL